MEEALSRLFSTVTVRWGSRAGGLVPTVETEERLKCQSQLVAFHMWQHSHKSSKTPALTSRPSEMGFGKWKTIPWQSWKEWLVQAVYRKVESCFFLSPSSLFWINSAYHAEIRARHRWGKETVWYRVLCHCVFLPLSPWWPEQAVGLAKSLAACLGSHVGWALEFWLKGYCMLWITGYTRQIPYDEKTIRSQSFS